MVKFDYMNIVSKMSNLSIGYIETSARVSKLRSTVQSNAPYTHCEVLYVDSYKVDTLLMHYADLTSHGTHFRGYGVSWIAIYWTEMLYLL